MAVVDSLKLQRRHLAVLFADLTGFAVRRSEACNA